MKKKKIQFNTYSKKTKSGVEVEILGTDPKKLPAKKKAGVVKKTEKTINNDGEK